MLFIFYAELTFQIKKRLPSYLVIEIGDVKFTWSLNVIRTAFKSILSQSPCDQTVENHLYTWSFMRIGFVNTK